LRYGGYRQQCEEAADLSVQIIFLLDGGRFANQPSLIEPDNEVFHAQRFC
jgi:hypothetical protein